jgi:hypothetical protein
LPQKEPIIDLKRNEQLKAMKIFGIPGTSFSPRRALGVDVLKRSIARATGIPTTRQGIERKIGRTLIKRIAKILK